MSQVTVYVTAVQAVRKTADDCRRILFLLSALNVAVDVVSVDTPEQRAFVRELLADQDGASSPAPNGGGSQEDTPVPLPLCFVGDFLIGSYDACADRNEDGTLGSSLREAGYTGPLRGFDDVPAGAAPPSVKRVVKKIVKKVVVVKSERDIPPPPMPPPDEDEEIPPPPGGPPADDAEGGGDDWDVPPPPPEEEEWDVPPPPPEDDEDIPPPPPDDDEDDIPPPPPE